MPPAKLYNAKNDEQEVDRDCVELAGFDPTTIVTGHSLLLFDAPKCDATATTTNWIVFPNANPVPLPAPYSKRVKSARVLGLP